MAHPVSLHSLDELYGSESNCLGLCSQIEGLAVSVDVEGGVDDGKLALEIQELKQLKEGSGQFKKVHIHLIAEINEEVRGLG